MIGGKAPFQRGLQRFASIAGVVVVGVGAVPIMIEQTFLLPV